jgi:sulfide:quinone oxidoreductase
MKFRVLVLGAGFGGLELTTILSEKIGNDLDLTIIDKSDSFYFGFSKLDVMFGNKPPHSVRIPYSSISKQGVVFRQENITSIDPLHKRVTTDKNSYEGDVVVVALGADYDIQATPGLAEGGNEFYSLEGAIKLRDVIPQFRKGNAIVGVAAAPFKCPPAPSEAALLLHDHLVRSGVRAACEISLVMPWATPIPPSPDSSTALLKAFEERNIHFIPKKSVRVIDAIRKVAKLDDGTEMPFDLFLGVPKHVAPQAVLESPLAENGWIPVNRNDLQTKFPGVYAIGDVTSVGTPKAGVFAEGAAKVAAEAILASYHRANYASSYKGTGQCYVEFGEGKVGRVDVDFFSGPSPRGTHTDASEEIAIEKEHFGSSRKERWFGKG